MILIGKKEERCWLFLSLFSLFFFLSLSLSLRFGDRSGPFFPCSSTLPCEDDPTYKYVQTFSCGTTSLPTLCKADTEAQTSCKVCVCVCVSVRERDAYSRNPIQSMAFFQFFCHFFLRID